MSIVWYFDYVSPFAYLQFMAHPDLVRRPDVELRPVLFAGLLDHWEHKGPAEIPHKRIHTFRLVAWQAALRGIPMRCPPAHPFNPLRVLRLTIALGASYVVVKTIFEFIWREGRSIDEDWPALLNELRVTDAASLVADGDVKARLRGHCEAAIASGVFGVPTFVVGKELFWGEDASGMLRDYLADPHLFESDAMRAIDAMPVGASRR